MITIEARDGHFIGLIQGDWDAIKREKEPLKEAGFRWDSAGKVWTTLNPYAKRQEPPERRAEMAMEAVRLALAAGFRVAERDSAKEAIETAKAKVAEELVKSAAAMEASRASASQAEVPVPPGKELFPFQRAGVSYILDAYDRGFGGVILGDEMGLGKSPSSVAVMNSIPKSEGPVLVVAPAFLKLNWAREIAAWDTQQRSVGIWTAKDRPDPGPDGIVVVNYDLVHKPDVEKDLRSRKWALVVADEAHYLKSRGAKRKAALLGDWQAKKEPITTKRWLFATGTPVTNRPKELWNLVRACVGGMSVRDHEGKDVTARFRRFWNPDRRDDSFAGRYCDARQGRYGLEADGESHLDELQTVMRSHFMVRRLKAEVLTELPAKTRHVVEIPAEDAKARKAVAAERAVHDRIGERLEGLAADVELAKASPRASDLEAAKEALAAARANAAAEIASARHQVALAKVPFVVDEAAAVLDEKPCVIVFAHHRDVVAGIAAGVEARIRKERGEPEWDGRPETMRHVRTVTGDTPMDVRQRHVDGFQAGEYEVFVANMQAAGVGLTLTRANTVLFAELDWVPGTMTQAEDRAHRIGQKDNVLVRHVVLEGSVDAELAATLIRKQDILDRALDRDAAAIDPDAVEAIVANAECGEDGPSVTRTEYASAATAPLTRTVVETTAPRLSATDVEAVHEALKAVHAACDGAVSKDGGGFSKVDRTLGSHLAKLPSLTPGQAVLGLRFAWRYRRQLPEGLAAKVIVAKEASERPMRPDVTKAFEAAAKASMQAGNGRGDDRGDRGI